MPSTAAVSQTVIRQEVFWPCPTVDVSCPDTSAPGKNVTFAASITGGNPSVKPTFNWTVSAGTIVRGQRARDTITVDTAGVSGTITATADVGGYDRTCTTSDSCTVTIPRRIEGRKIDEYSNIGPGDEENRLYHFAIELQNDPAADGYIVVYAPAR